MYCDLFVSSCFVLFCYYFVFFFKFYLYILLQWTMKITVALHRALMMERV